MRENAARECHGFSVHEGIGFLALMIFLLWLLATSIALVVRGERA